MEKLIVPSLLTVPEVVSMTDTILKITLPASLSDSRFRILYARVKLIFDRLVKNQKNTTKSGLTEKMLQGDKKRDAGFLSFRYIVFGMTMSLMADVAAKAAVLFAIIEKNGKRIYSLTYKTESAVLLSLFNDLDQPVNQELMIGLGILPYYESLKAAEAEFNLLSLQKTDEKTIQNNDSEAATMVMHELMPELTNMIGLLQLYSDLEPAVYRNIYNHTETCISDTNALARSRISRKQNNKDEEKTVSS